MSLFPKLPKNPFPYRIKLLGEDYSPDQPRDDHGRFGAGAAAEKASTAPEHDAAAKYHDRTANALYNSGKNDVANLHSQAARAHEQAAQTIRSNPRATELHKMTSGFAQEMSKQAHRGRR